jgi:hypothetical protein
MLAREGFCIKKRHPTYLSALRHAAWLDIAFHDDEAPVVTYVCLKCGGLHVGHDVGFKALRTALDKVDRFLSNPEVQLKAKPCAIANARRRKASLLRQARHWAAHYLKASGYKLKALKA